MRFPKVSREGFLRVMGQVVAMAVMLITGNLYAFNAYSDALKLQMNYTQAAANQIAAMGNLGGCIAPPAGWVMDMWGHYPTLAVGGILSFLGYILMWAGTAHRIVSNGGLMSFFFFISGQGLNFLYFAALLLAIRNFPGRMRGLIVGLLESSYGASAAMFSAIYSSAFAGSNDLYTQNVPGFLLLLAFLCAGTMVLGLVFLRSLPPTEAAEEEDTVNIQQTVTDAEHSPLLPHREGLLTGEQKADVSELAKSSWKVILVRETMVFRKLNFWLIFTVYFTASSVALMYVDNVSFMLQAVGQAANIPTHTIAMPIASTVGRIATGIISDIVLERWRVSRGWFILGAVLVLTGVQICLVFWMPQFMLAASILVGFSSGSLWVMGSPTVSEEFGLRSAGSNWSYVIVSSACGLLLYQWFVALIYTQNSGGAADCGAGVACYRTSFIICAATLGLAVGSSVLLLKRIKIPSWAGKHHSKKIDLAVPSELVQANDGSDVVKTEGQYSL